MQEPKDDRDDEICKKVNDTVRVCRYIFEDDFIDSFDNS